MLKSMPSKLFAEWQAFYQLEPFGEWRQDFRSAQICEVLANINRNPDKRSKPYSPFDFIVDFTAPRKSKKKIDMVEMKSKLVAIAAAFKPRNQEKPDA